MVLKDSQTVLNLGRAFAGESQARNRYTFAADFCKQNNLKVLYNIFTFTANQEKTHAKVFYDFLKEVNGQNFEIEASYPYDNYDNVGQLLDSATHNEFAEYEVVYPSFADTARNEGFTQIAAAFEMIAKIEKEHGERFKAFSQLYTSSEMYKAPEETEWMCLHCGHIHKGTDAPQVCPVCKSLQGFFIPFKYYHFKSGPDYSKNC